MMRDGSWSSTLTPFTATQYDFFDLSTGREEATMESIDITELSDVELDDIAGGAVVTVGICA